MRYEIERIEVWPAVKIGFFVGAALGFLIGAVWAGLLVLISGLASMVVPEEVGRGLFAIPAAAGMMIPFVTTLVQGILWALLAAIGVFIYNLLSRWVGGLVLHLTPDDTDQEHGLRGVGTLEKRDKSFDVGSS